MKRQKSKKIANRNQQSFYFEDYLSKNQKFKKDKNFSINEDRIYLLFFCFFSLIFIFSLKIIFVSFQSSNFKETSNFKNTFNPLRKDIVDRNGILLSRNILAYHAAIKPNLIKDKKKFLVKIKITLPEINTQTLKKDLEQKKYFYLKKRLTDLQREKLWKLGEKGIIFEPFQTRVYPHAGLYSHILGQTDYDNYGISGVEKYFDRELKDKNNLSKPLKLTLDSNIQYIIKKELNKGIKTFSATGGGALLMNVNNGDIISLVSLPNFNINQRSTIKDKNFINKITKGVYELGSIFKTFTVALALENKLVDTDTIIKEIPKKIKCSIHEITDIKEHPKNLSVEEILVRSSNVGSVVLARKIGVEKYNEFIKKTKITNSPEIELEERGSPHRLKWNKCKLETISFGHGITTTPLQASALYAAMSNGGNLIKPSLIKNRKIEKLEKIISQDTSSKLSNILRKVVSSHNGTASLADIDGYYVGGKTGTAESYGNQKNRINSFMSIFPSNKPNYTLFVMLENPKINTDLIYDYRGIKTKAPYNTSGWNSVYIAGKIIERIGPILAINNEEFTDLYVAEKFN